MNKREKIGLTILASAAVVGVRLLYGYIRKGKWGKYW